MTRLDGKIALITGGTSGMGAAAAKLFQEEGATVIVTGVKRAKRGHCKEEFAFRAGDSLRRWRPAGGEATRQGGGARAWARRRFIR